MACQHLNYLLQSETSASSLSLSFCPDKAETMIFSALRNGFKDQTRRQVLKSLTNAKFFSIAPFYTGPYPNILEAVPI